MWRGWGTKSFGVVKTLLLEVLSILEGGGGTEDAHAHVYTFYHYKLYNASKCK